MPKMARTCRPTGDCGTIPLTIQPSNHPPTHCLLAFVQPHAPLWCALEFHAFICKDYEMRPVAAKVLYAFPANCRQCLFLLVCPCLCVGFPSSPALYPIAFLSFSSCLLVRPPVRFADLLRMQKSVANTQTRLQPRRWE